MAIPSVALADNNAVKNGDFEVAFDSSKRNLKDAEVGEWFYVTNKAAAGKITFEAAKDAANGNAVRIENNADGRWYSGYLVQKVVLDASEGEYTLSFDAKSVAGSPVVRTFIIDEVTTPKAQFVARASFDPKAEKNAVQSPAAPSKGAKVKKWKNYTFDFDAKKSVNTMYSPKATAKAGKSIDYTKLKGKNEFYVCIQVTGNGQAILIDNIVLEPTK